MNTYAVTSACTLFGVYRSLPAARRLLASLNDGTVDWGYNAPTIREVVPADDAQDPAMARAYRHASENSFGNTEP